MSNILDAMARLLTLRVLRMCLFPAALYLVLFVALTFPLITRFSTHLFADTGDGLVFVWNSWWVRQATVELRQSPWHTTYLHYPEGISLHGHTLSLFNCYLMWWLESFLSRVEAYNAVVLFAFVGSGLTAFLLAHHVSRSYAGSLLAGTIFTFSNYHFAHAEGHLNLISLEWLPLFLLCWLLLLERPSPARGVAAGLSLCAVAWCDLYYLLYGTTAACLLAGWEAFRRRNLWLLCRGAHLRALAAFLACFLALMGPTLAAFIVGSLRDPFLGGHYARLCAADLLAPLIPGAHWRFGHLTEAYWSRLPLNRHETSLHLGAAVLFAIAYVLRARRKIREPETAPWLLLLGFFLVMSLGPRLYIGGWEVPALRLPYWFAQVLFPPVRLAGVPARMMILVILCAAVLTAVAWAWWSRTAGRRRWLAAPLLVLLAVEYLPAPLPTTRIPEPGYLAVLRSLPSDAGLIDTLNPPGLQLYFQTLHERPMAFGYTSRITRRAAEQEQAKKRLIEHGAFDVLWREYHLRYLLARATDAHPPGARLLYRDAQAALYDLAPLADNPPGELGRRGRNRAAEGPTG